MMLSRLSATPFCRRSQSTAPDLEPGLVPEEPPSLSNNQGATIAQSTESEIRSNAEEPLKDMVGVMAISKDPLYLIVMRCRPQTAYVLNFKGKLVIKHWQDMIKAKERNDPDIEKFEMALSAALQDYLQFSKLINQFEAFPRPNTKLLAHYLEIARKNMGIEAEHLDGALENWASPYPVDTLDLLTRLIPEYAWGRWLLRPFLQQTEDHDGFSTYKFAEVAFKVLLFTVLLLLVVTLVGAPVVVQALGVTSVGVNAILYMVCLFVFAGLSHMISKNESTVFLTTLAYAAVVVANLGRGQ